MSPPPRRRPVLVAIAIACVAWVAVSLYQGLGSGMARFYTSRARDRIERGEIDASAELLARAVAWDESHAASRKLLARYSAGTGEIDRARELLRTIEDADPSVLDLLARLQRAEGAIDAATATYQQLTVHAPEHPAGWVGLARLGRLPDSLSTHIGVDVAPTPAETATPHYRGLALLHLEDDLGAEGYGTAACVESLVDGRRHGANAVSLRVPGRQTRIDDPAIRFGRELPGRETDDAVRETIRDAHVLDYRVMLKPHIMLDRITEAEWRGAIAFDSPTEHARWWTDYRAFILHYAALAAAESVEIYCVGVELRAMVSSSPDEWRRLIADVRKVFPGRVTYAANWYHEIGEVGFWADLDLIGVQFFFPLSDDKDPDVDALRRGAVATREGLAELATWMERPVIFTEVGYKSTPGAAAEPWHWPSEGSVPDLELQRDAYRAILDTFDDQPWFGGLFWWNWLSTPTPDAKFRHDFTPQGKPAAELLRQRWK